MNDEQKRKLVAALDNDGVFPVMKVGEYRELSKEGVARGPFVHEKRGRRYLTRAGRHLAVAYKEMGVTQ